jgi:hypothetical protein
LLAEPPPLEQVAVPEKLHVTNPRGTGIEGVVLGCHIRYILALKDLVTVVNEDSSCNIGESFVGGPG